MRRRQFAVALLAVALSPGLAHACGGMHRSRPPQDMVALDTATVEQLERLGLEEEEALAIVHGRPYKTVDELVTRGIISRDTYDKIARRIRVAHHGMPGM